MDTALPQKFPFILDRNLAKSNGTGNRVCTSCDTVVLVLCKISLDLGDGGKNILFDYKRNSMLPLYYSRISKHSTLSKF